MVKATTLSYTAVSFEPALHQNGSASIDDWTVLWWSKMAWYGASSEMGRVLSSGFASTNAETRESGRREEVGIE